MHFTAGLPFRILADGGGDPNAWKCPPGHPPYLCGSKLEFFVDGGLVGTKFDSDALAQIHGWEADLPSGLPVGTHILSVRYTIHDPATDTYSAPVNGTVPVTIYVDAAPTHTNTITLSSDLRLSGSTPLNWSDATVIGNGFKVTAAPGYRGAVTIQNCFIRGLATYDQSGIDVTTTGAIAITNSIFEATAPVHLVATGAAPTITGNEFRANNFIDYVLSNPDMTPVLDVTSGAATGVLQANNFGGGIVKIQGAHWHVGGLVPGQGNVIMGPRGVLMAYLTDSTIEGNYIHHDYTGWSQGFNLEGTGSTDRLLVQHNIFRGGSWVYQNIGGEVRYNLSVDDAGHDSWRTIKPNTKIHHNLFTYPASPNSGFLGMLMTYQGESGIDIYNNTFDTAGATSAYNAPAIAIGTGSVFASVRSNLFQNFSDVANTPIGTVAGPSAGLRSADYNDFWNLRMTTTPHYSIGLVTPGSHDKAANPLLAGALDVPYKVDEGLIWLRQLTVWQVLAYYRATYTPTPGSPLIDAGDPQEGSGNDIGAIGAGLPNALDLFGTLNVTPAATHPALWMSASHLVAILGFTIIPRS
jgi:hypothetical protein